MTEDQLHEKQAARIADLIARSPDSNRVALEVLDGAALYLMRTAGPLIAAQELYRWADHYAVQA